MKAAFSKKRSIFQARYRQNAVLHLVLASAVGYILLQALKVIFIILSDDPASVAYGQIVPNFALQPWDAFLTKPWVLLTFTWGHLSFWNLLSNMLWMYCFGSVIQNLIGYKEVIPMFLVTTTGGALLYLVTSAFWETMPPNPLFGALPGVLGFAVAAFVLAPRFRFYLGDRFAIPLWVVILVFLLLNAISLQAQNGMWVLLAGSAVTAAAYMKLLQSGRNPGRWIYGAMHQVQGQFDREGFGNKKGNRRKRALGQFSDSEKGSDSEEYIDQLLDKINQKGYGALSREEKDALIKASKKS